MDIKFFVINELSNKFPGLKVGGEGKNILLICPWHNETKPSLSVNLREGKVRIGTFRCFGCDESGSWNKLAEKLGLQTIDSESVEYTKDVTISALKQRFKEFLAKQEGPKLPPRLLEWKGSWRGLTEDFLKQFKPALYYDSNWKENRILFPIIQFEKLRGYLHERCEKTDSLKHLFSEGFPSMQVLYPTDLHKGTVAVLVEGLADMLRLRRDGIPALTFFGCGNWNYKKVTILQKMGINKIIICGDGDNAGYAINDTIKDDLKKFNIRDAEIFNIPRRSYEIRNYTKDQLIAYAEDLKILDRIARDEDRDFIFDQISAIIDKHRYDPGNMPVKYVKALKKVVAGR